MGWVEVYEQAAERAHSLRVDGAPGVNADIWHRLYEAIDASGWVSGRSLAPRHIREIAHAAVAVLCPPTSERRPDRMRLGRGW
ncbi:hypothetical protein D5S18_18455 [Nocardia panacis]|uniref:Uncharacterized protein n=1 Tax=Nocardia panacis TaxID=2340916 RepID=A0A3A4KIB5_9NOCA|nr:hypothetical protein [Nocardia panacis]RJO74135.1 hypothetical protein D5S18_18455 [Nocardia panacis]